MLRIVGASWSDFERWVARQPFETRERWERVDRADWYAALQLKLAEFNHRHDGPVEVTPRPEPVPRVAPLPEADRGVYARSVLAREAARQARVRQVAGLER